MSDLPLLSIVIPVLDGAATIAEQIRAIDASRRSMPVEVIVSDNGSTDDTRRIARSCERPGLDVRIVDSGDRRGISHARNVGVRRARAENIAICDADDRVDERWVPAMLDGLAAHDVVTGPLLVTEINPTEVAYSRGTGVETEAPTFVGLFRYPHGCNHGFRRPVFETVGGFDEGMAGIISEDIDFGLRLSATGFEIGFLPDAAVHYRYRRGAGALFRQGLAYGTGRAFVARRARQAGWAVPHFAGIRSWVWLLLHLPDVARSSRRESWTWVAGNRLGQLRGSVRHRTLFL